MVQWHSPELELLWNYFRVGGVICGRESSAAGAAPAAPTSWQKLDSSSSCEEEADDSDLLPPH